MKPIEVESNWFPFWNAWAVTLFPFVFYKRPHKTECIRQHEMYHFKQALKYFVLPWYLWYLILQIFYFRNTQNHPLERKAYKIQRECESKSL